jgi:hypothetical protein
MSSLKPDKPQLPNLPLAQPVEHTFTLDGTEVKQVEGRWTVVGATHRTKTVYADGRTVEEDHRVRVPSITFSPDFSVSKDFEPVFPEGTLVHMHGVLGIRFHWARGRPVPTVDAEAVAQIDSAVGQVISGPTNDALVALRPPMAASPEGANAAAQPAAAGPPTGRRSTRGALLALAAVSAAAVVIAAVVTKRRRSSPSKI